MTKRHPVGRITCQKPPPRSETKRARERERWAKGSAFRTAVWTRDGGRCRVCGCAVRHELYALHNRGEVHHLRGRRVAPQDRYNVNAAVLVCSACHLKLTRHDAEAEAALERTSR